MGSDITCIKSLTMAEVSASQPAGLVIFEESVDHSELKSPRIIIPECTTCRLIVLIDVERLIE